MGARELLADAAAAGLSIGADGERLVVRPASMLTGNMREALRLAKPELLALLRAGRTTPAELDAVAWNDGDIARFLARRTRLLRWGWPEADAERCAEQLVKRDRESDSRVNCTECRHHRPGRCGNHRRAGLSTATVGHDLVVLLQRCPGFGATP